MSRKTENDTLSPIKVDRHTWMYAEKRHLCVVREIMDTDAVLIRTEIFNVPWRKIEYAVSVREVSRKRRGK